MLSKADIKKGVGENSGNAKLLGEIDTISKALYTDRKLQRLASSTASSRSKSVGKSHLPEPKTKPKDAKKSNKDPLDDEKKSSIWSWKGLKALTNTRNRRFNCCFSLLVHSIEGLPAFFDNVCLIVHWKRRDGEQTTRPVRVFQRIAEFEQQLIHSCSVYGSRSGPHHSAKYEAKHFLLYASVYDAPDLDLGKHRIDLTRLLPLTLEELDEEKTSGKWTTSFRLSGKARGAVLNVSFGYVIGNNGTEGSGNNNLPPNISRFPKLDQMDELGIRRSGSLPTRSSISNRSVEDIKDLHEVLPISKAELSESVSVLYKKLDEEMSKALDENKLNEDACASPPETHNKLHSLAPLNAGEKDCETECDANEFSVTEKGVEMLMKDDMKSENELLKLDQDSGESPEVDVEVPDGEGGPPQPSVEESIPVKDEQMMSMFDSRGKEDDMSAKESIMKELETALSCVTDLASEGLDSQEDETDALLEGHSLQVNSNYRDRQKGKSLSFDAVADSVASDFLEMLGIEHSPFGFSSESEPESPRERLLREFEKDALANGGLLNFDIDDYPAEVDRNIPMEAAWESISEDFDHSAMFESYDEVSMIDSDVSRIRTRASRMEDLETEALMREWGLNEKAFQHSPARSSGGFGSPIDMPTENVQQLPPLAEGLGPFVQTKDGGFLRSMNPGLFRNAKSGGSLIMQVSNPVVVPAEMGSGVMDILQGLASVGIEKLSMQANRLMPLEDITGKTIQQIAWEAAPSLEGPERRHVSVHEGELLQNTPSDHNVGRRTSCGPRSSKCDPSLPSNDSEYVSLDDLAPLAMDKIEALSIEGLRIQSGLSDDDAPLNISTQSIGEFSALKGKTVDAGGSIGLDGTCGLQLLDIKDNGEDVEGLMGLSLTLDEWMKLDSGEIDDDDLRSERTSKILAAHHATSLDQFRGRSKGEKRRGKGRKYGLLGNNFTVALMVQLRDPLRNYEPVGTPMLALIQVERVFVPPKPKFCSTVSLVKDLSEEEEEKPKVEMKDHIAEDSKEEKAIEELIPQYKIAEVHVAGLKSEPNKKKWGSANQQQAGSRWLLANGMGKKNKHPLMKSKAIAKSSGGAGDKLWSLSSRSGK